ncbi:MAG: Tat pathway signal protein [Colwellia sp.]|nr:MAG: Tat pathway signal protein [Colwellia sp.]
MKKGDNKSEDNQSRRRFLKSAAGATAIAVYPVMPLSAKQQEKALVQLNKLRKTDPWLTLEATLMHLLPESEASTEASPSAKSINALAYLYQVMTVQPTEEEEKEFIIKGVGWLNGFAQSQQGKPFVQLSIKQKEVTLRGISNSSAGSNWLSTLLAYIFEAMLAPPAYGGNPDGIGWQWLEHQGGFPLPKIGQRYFELPLRGKAKNQIAIRAIEPVKSNTRLANTPLIKRTNKA